MNKKVMDYTTCIGEQNFDLMQHIFPIHIFEKIRAIAPPSIDEWEDKPTWKLTSDGNFSIKSAYQIFNMWIELNQMKYEAKFGKGEGPKDLRYSCGKPLMTAYSSQRHGRCNGSCSNYHKCTTEIEIVFHTLQDSPMIFRIWIGLVTFEFILDFFDCDMRDQIYLNFYDCMYLDLAMEELGNI